MLVVTRKVGQSVKIGPDIVVTICSARSGAVQIGIEAPEETPIHRANGSPSAVRANRFCSRCTRWVEPTVWSGDWNCCDVCASEAPTRDDEEPSEDIHEEDHL